MTDWIPSVLETLGFASGSNPPSKRRVADDGRDSTKAPRFRTGQYCRDADAYMAEIESMKQQATHDFSPADFDVDYEYITSISDTDSLQFDGLYPVLPPTAKQRHPPTRLIASPPKTIVPTAVKAAASSPSAASAKSVSTPDSPSAPWAPGTTLSQKWSTRPNKRAREVMSDTTNSRQSIVNEVGEPEYSMRDVEIGEGFEELKNMMCEFSEENFTFEVKVASPVEGRQFALAPNFYKQFSEETAKVIGCVASGGPGGVQGWHDLFIEPVKRMALCNGIVGNVLIEQVFQHLFFGGTERHVSALVEMQKKYAEEDGFVRNTHYANYTRSILDPKSTNSFVLPSNFANHVNHIVGVLVTHLSPILNLNPSHPSASTLIRQLRTIVTHAGLLSLTMRADPHTVYHFAPIFKEETFSHSRMECFNALTMQQTNPQTSDTDPALRHSERRRRAALSEAERKRSRNDDALTQIALMDGVTAYRLGGWEEPDSKVTNVKYEKIEYANEGVRERVLSKAWTYCRWGKARAFKAGKPDDKAAQHGVAWKGGFKEFTDVEGVKDWLQAEKKGNKKGKGKTEADIQAELSDQE